MKPENVKCPECGGPMVSRANTRDGSRFWGCKSFPKCRGTRNAMGMSREDVESTRELEDEDMFHPGNPRFFG